MEIAPVPHRPPVERRALFVGLLVLAPVVLLVVLPAVLGLDRYVVTDDSMGHSMGRGSVVLARHVPSGDLKVGDVVTFVPPHQTGHPRVTHRVVSLDGDFAVTRGDAATSVDPWRLRLDRPTYARVFVHVPWIGYPFTLDGGEGLLVAAAVLALGLGGLVTLRRPLGSRLGAARGAAAARPRVPVT